MKFNREVHKTICDVHNEHKAQLQQELERVIVDKERLTADNARLNEEVSRLRLRIDNYNASLCVGSDRESQDEREDISAQNKTAYTNKASMDSAIAEMFKASGLASSLGISIGDSDE